MDEGLRQALLIVHGSLLADGCVPLVNDRMLRRGLRPVLYQRRGHGAVPVGDRPLDIRAQAEDALHALAAAGLPCAHVLGQSAGASIALQLAINHPKAVRSLILIEPALMTAVPGGSEVAVRLSAVAARHAAGQRAAAVDALFAFCNPSGYRSRFDERLPPGWFERAVANAPVFFEGEARALAAWSIAREDAERVTAPVLLVCGAESPPVFHQTRDLLASWLPNAHVATIDGSGHHVAASSPEALAGCILSFVETLGARKSAIAAESGI